MRLEFSCEHGTISVSIYMRGGAIADGSSEKLGDGALCLINYVEACRWGKEMPPQNIV